MKRKPNNPRQISKREFERLAADLERFGDLGGVVHNETTGNFVGGNQRSSVFELERQGAQITVTETYAEPTRTGTVARGYVEWRGERYDYRRVRWDTETEDAACLVANLRGGSWDFDALSAWDGDLLQGIGFDGDLLAAWNDQTANLRELLESEKPAPPEDPGAQVDKAEELREKWQTATGQLWQLGEHRLICGDCTNVEIIERLMQGETADMVFTDPPYGMRLDADFELMSKRSNRVMGNKYSDVINDDKDFDPMPFIKMFPEAKEQMWWGADYYYDKLPPNGSWIVWVKRNENMTDIIGNHFEVCWSMAKHKRKVVFKAWSGVTARNPEFSREHPTEKPIELNAELIAEATVAGDLVIDLFAGVGTTLIACERLGRKCRAVEIEPKYVAVALERWATMTGGTPVLLDDGC